PWTWATLALASVALAAAPHRAPALRAVRAVLAAGAVVLVAVAVHLGARILARQQSYPPMSILTADTLDIMFRGKPTLEVPYMDATQRVRASDCHVIGLE